MKYSTKLSDTIHILIFIALGDDEQLSSTKIAESIKTNPAYIRQLMATLKNAGIVVNTQGHANAALAKSADKINMYDIYRAVEGDKPLLHLDTDTNPDCGIGINIQFAIGDFYHEIQNMVDEKMKSITLQDIIELLTDGVQQAIVFINNEEYFVKCYEIKYDEENVFKIIYFDNIKQLLNACCEMLIWVAENGYLTSK